MDDFKIIFYILVAIAWVVYKNYQKIKANRPQAKTSPPPAGPYNARSEDSVKQWKKEVKPALSSKPKIERVPTRREIKKPAAKKVKIEAGIGSEAAPDFSTVETASTAAFFKSILSEEMNAIKSPQEKTEKETESREWNFNPEKINLKEAVIYSTILNRPY